MGYKLHKDLPVIEFQNQKLFETWLSRNHDKFSAVWIRIYKVNSGTTSIKMSEVVDSCLCYGWIDGLANGYDEKSYLIRLTPRKSKSKWSKINVANIARLIEAGRMTPYGQKCVDEAKNDGRFYDTY